MLGIPNLYDTFKNDPIMNKIILVHAIWIEKSKWLHRIFLF